MNRFFLILVAGLSFALGDETVHLKSGKFQKGKLISQTDEDFTFEFKRAGVTGTSRVKIPWRSVDRIEFQNSARQIDALANPGQTDLKVFADLWKNSSPWITRPNSKAAVIGLAYAKKLATSEAEMAAEQALDIFDTVSKRAWNPEDQATGLRERLKTLLALGREREAIREAETLAAESENPTLLLEARHILATNAFDRLKAIEEENPRWELDDDVRPDRFRYFNEAIDNSLFAYLFYGTEEQAAADGLLHAAEVYEFAKDANKARQCANDIIKLYPGTKAAQPAAVLLDKLSNE